MAGMSRVESKALNVRIKKLYSQGLGSRAIGSALGLNPVAVYRRLRRMGINRSLKEHIEAQEDRLPNNSSPFLETTRPENLRDAALGKAMGWFLGRGHVVSVPTTPTSYDLVVETNSGFKKIQIKTTTRRERSGAWAAQIVKRPYDATLPVGAAGKRRAVPYNEGEVDYFFIVTGDQSIYIIPFGVVRGLQGISLGQKYTKYCRCGGMADTPA